MVFERKCIIIDIYDMVHVCLLLIDVMLQLPGIGIWNVQQYSVLINFSFLKKLAALGATAF